MAGTKVFITHTTKVKSELVKAGEVVAVDKADFATLTKLGRGVDPDTAEGKERIRVWKQEQAELEKEQKRKEAEAK